MKTEIIPVIHMVDEEQVFANVDTCIKCGIEKVFLINHNVEVDELLRSACKVKNIFPDLWVGVNMLGLTTEESLARSPIGIDGIWCDSSLEPHQGHSYQSYKRKHNGMFFGGLAFKYQPQPKDLQTACELSKLVTDVATTSGVGTGQSPTTFKIKTIREYLGEHPMAIASGISSENIHLYKDLANYLLVATSITDRNEMIIEEKLMELKSKI